MRALRTILAASMFATAGAARADNADNAATILAAVTVCNTPVSAELRRRLYGDLLAYAGTPHMVTYEINKEIEALNALSPGERDAMCLAIGDVAKRAQQ